ncbi:MAG: tRNA (adenosine(37)-N6)-threonylcarbamoyltransferase complex dimerization subunit type 1 TsaB [Cytophagaceae bacterium]|nr:tRNA (adenosine(37)-N6)-threonylcarbamoyltransferase complex dimerization subunit type 1 TsaB [Cytophagaceae bacterium]MDW8455541.1 tRNA (adenosine(37)-N6)-threonylcarbamoyltransferase complex dimerization subunit type 1 TsaB [Cytophagaceae bacterium]
MALILSIETSTDVCSAALHEKGVLCAYTEIHIEKSHAKYITVLIEQLFKQTGHNIQSIDAVAVSKGPGSYTGLRIGVSTAKGICFALDKPLIGVSTLLSMAHGQAAFNTEKYFLAPMIDARRMEVYTMLLDADLNVVEDVNAKIIDEHTYHELLQKNKIIFFGNGSAKCKSLLQGQPNALFVGGQYPSAKDVGQLAWESFQESKFEDVAYFEPYYLKDFIRFGKSA